LLALQRFSTASALAFAAVHVLGLTLADQVRLDPADLVVPLAAPDQPGAVAWGIAALALLVAVTVASFVARHAGRHTWLVAHLASLLAFAAGSAHALTMQGSDIDRPAIWWSTAVGAAALVGSTVARLATNGNPFAAAGTAVTPQSDIERELQQREREITAQLRRDADRPDSVLLERTLAGLRSLDDQPRRVEQRDAVSGPFDLLMPPPIVAHPDPVSTFPLKPGERRLLVDRDDLAPGPPGAHELPGPRPLSPAQAVSGSIFPSAEDLRQSAGPLDLTVPPGLQEHAPEPEPWDATPAEHVDARAPRELTSIVPRALPVRTPRRVARTTAAAGRIDAWQPARAAAAPVSGPPAPPAAIDPVTGEPDPTAYRQWLKDWLAYVESQN
jgi:hypothetical protein